MATERATIPETGEVLRQLTVDEVLTRIRLHCNAFFTHGLVRHDFKIEFKTSLEDLCDEFDFGSWRHLGTWFNHLFGADLPEAEWRRALHPPGKRTLRDVCEFVSGHIQVPEIKALTLAGSSCTKAGAFMFLKAHLIQAGACPRRLAPSTPLVVLERRGLPRIYKQLLLTAPKLQHSIKVRGRRDGLFLLAGGLLFIASMGTAIYAVISPIHGLPYFLGIFGVFLLVWYGSHLNQRRPPKRVTFVGLQTVRDLCSVMAGEWHPQLGPYCWKCGFNLYRNTTGACPECGRHFEPEDFGLSVCDVGLGSC